MNVETKKSEMADRLLSLVLLVTVAKTLLTFLRARVTLAGVRMVAGIIEIFR